MGIPIFCKTCNKKYVLKDSFAGKKIKCPGCSSVLTVPAAKKQTAPSAKKESTEFAFADETTDKAIICGNCGKELKPGSVVCVDCGFHLETGAKLTTLDVDKYLEEMTDKKRITIPRPKIMFLVGGVMGAISLAALIYGAIKHFSAENPSITTTIYLALGGLMLLFDFLYFTGRRIALTLIRAAYALLSAFTFWMVILSFTHPVWLLVYIPAFLGAGLMFIVSLNPNNDDYCIL